MSKKTHQSTSSYAGSKKPYLWITLAVLAVYGWTVFFNYTYLDDYTLLVQNSEVFSNFGNLFRVFTNDLTKSVTGGDYYRPFFAASLILNAVIAGQSAFLYHLTNVLLHLGVCLLLYRFLLLLTKNDNASLLGSLVFAVHPLLVQTVAWIPGRNDSLAAIFILWALLSFTKALDHPAEKKPYVYAAIATLLALGTKELAVFIPFISVIYTWLVSKAENKYKTMARFIPIWAALLILWFIGRSVTLAESPDISFASIFSSLVFFFPSVLQYLGKMIFPFNLSTYPTIADLNLLYGYIALGVLGAASLMAKNKNTRVLLFGVIWFFTFLMTAFVRLKATPYDEVLEHRSYVPFIGLLIIILSLELIPRDFFISRVRLYAACVLLASLAFLNFLHASDFRSGLRYWERAGVTSPNSAFALRELGAMRQKDGQILGAEQAYKKAIALATPRSLVYNNLGLLYAIQGRTSEAEIMYRTEIASTPDFDRSYTNLGNLYWETNRQDAARDMWQKAIEINPYFFPTYRNLAIYYYEKEQIAEGLAVLRQIAERGGRVDPDIAEAYAPYLQNQ